jgi:hypothetical protein
MAGAAEGVWLDSESIHALPPNVRSAGLDSTGREGLVICRQVPGSPPLGIWTSVCGKLPRFPFLGGINKSLRLESRSIRSGEFPCKAGYRSERSKRVALVSGRVARALSLNFGCPVLDVFSRAGLLTCFSRPASGHGIDANQTGFLLRVK